MPKKSLAQSIAPQPEQTPLAQILASYNAGTGGPEGTTLLSILARQKDPRAHQWIEWENQRRKDIAANNTLLDGSGPPPPDMPSGRLPEAYITNESIMPYTGANRVQGQPMAPGAYEAMMADITRKMLIDKGRASPLGREQALKNASNNIGMLWDKERIANTPMPAEIGSPGLNGKMFELFRTMIGDKRAF